MRVLAYREDGTLTYCTCTVEKRGTGRCKHVMHMNNVVPGKRVSKSQVQDFVQYCEKLAKNGLISDLYMQYEGKFSYDEISNMRRYCFMNLLTGEIRDQMIKIDVNHEIFYEKESEVDDERAAKVKLREPEVQKKYLKFQKLMNVFKEQHPELYETKERMMSVNYRTFLDKEDMDMLDGIVLRMKNCSLDRLRDINTQLLQQMEEIKTIWTSDESGRFTTSLKTLKRDEESKKIYNAAVEEAMVQSGWEGKSFYYSMFPKIKIKRYCMRRSLPPVEVTEHDDELEQLVNGFI